MKTALSNHFKTQNNHNILSPPYSPPGVATDSRNKCCRTLGVFMAMLLTVLVVASHQSAQAQASWPAQAGGTAYDVGRGVAVLPDGSAIVTGQFRGTATFGAISLTSAYDSDVFVAKLGADGAWLWATQAGGVGTALAWGVSVLADGSAIVTGAFRGTATFGATTLTSAGPTLPLFRDDVFVAKISAAGAWVWATQAGGTGHDLGWGVSVLADGSAVVTGRFIGTATFGTTSLVSAGDNDVFVAKISAAGAWVWATKAGGPGFDQGYRVSVLADGSAILTGFFTGTATFGATPSLTSSGAGDSDVFVAKIGAAGAWLWATSAGGGTGFDQGVGVSVLADGSAIVTGPFEGTATFGAIPSLTSAGAEDVFVAKIGAAGAWLWATRAGGTASDVGIGISVLADGSAIVTGRFTGTATFGATPLTSAGIEDVFFAKIGAAGAWLWATRAGGPTWDESWDVSVLADGSSIVIGAFGGTADFGVIPLTSTGSDDVFVARIGPAPQMAINAGNSQTSTVGTAVTTAPSVIVRDPLNNLASGVTVTFAVASGGGSITGGSATTNASGIATVGSWTLGPVAGSNTLTATSAGLAGSPLTFTATGTAVIPVVTASAVLIDSSPSIVTGQGATKVVTQNLTNTFLVPATVTYVASLPAGLTGVSCSVPFGTCVIGAGVKIAASGGEIYRRQSVSSPASTSTVTWTGTIPANGTVMISYVVQVSVLATNGTQYQLTPTINGISGPSATITVSATPAGPGDSIGLVLGQASVQKPGSVLIYNLYASGSNPAVSDSRVSITNTSPVRSSYVHFFFVDGSNCSVADMTITLTPNQTTSFLASDFDPGVTGYLIAIATDANGCPEVYNHLVGESQVRLESGHRAALPALSVAALGLGGPTCSPNATTTTMAFDGLNYNALSRTLAVSGLSSIANGNSSLLVVNRIGGDLGTGAARLGSLFGLLYDDQEASQSFTLTGNVCQLRGVLGNNFPRTSPRYTTVIPAGRTGWMKFAAVADEAITGVLLVEGFDGFSGGHNLHHLTTTNTATLTIPVYPAQ
jgi:hypothetical protein